MSHIMYGMLLKALDDIYWPVSHKDITKKCADMK